DERQRLRRNVGPRFRLLLRAIAVGRAFFGDELPERLPLVGPGRLHPGLPVHQPGVEAAAVHEQERSVSQAQLVASKLVAAQGVSSEVSRAPQYAGGW